MVWFEKSATRLPQLGLWEPPNSDHHKLQGHGAVGGKICRDPVEDCNLRSCLTASYITIKNAIMKMAAKEDAGLTCPADCLDSTHICLNYPENCQKTSRMDSPEPSVDKRPTEVGLPPSRCYRAPPARDHRQQSKLSLPLPPLCTLQIHPS